MPESLLLRLDACARLSPHDREAVSALGDTPHEVAPRNDLIREGERPTVVHLVVSGLGYSYKSLPDGRRQIVNFLVPGDFCELDADLLEEIDHSVAAITRMRVAQITPEAMASLRSEHPRISRALSREKQVSESILREWILNVGQRNAQERISHLLIELFLRLRLVRLTRGDSCDFPLTQADIADATGLTPVHVNRTLQGLRRENLIELEHKQLRIPDLERLMAVAVFNPNYLHLNAHASG